MQEKRATYKVNTQVKIALQSLILVRRYLFKLWQSSLPRSVNYFTSAAEISEEARKVEIGHPEFTVNIGHANNKRKPVYAFYRDSCKQPFLSDACGY